MLVLKHVCKMLKSKQENKQLIRVALVDDHDLFRGAIKNLLEKDPHIQVVLESKNGLDFLEKLRTNHLEPDILLLDINMPEMDGYETLSKLSELFPHIKVIALSAHKDKFNIIKMFRMGVNGYLAKDASPDKLSLHIKTVYKDDYHFDSDVIAVVQNYLEGKELTTEAPKIEINDQEKEILVLICKGLTDKKIGKTLSMSHRTVEGYRKRLLKRFGVKNSVGLAVFAVVHHLVDVNP